MAKLDRVGCWMFSSASRRSALLTTYYISPFSRSAVSPELTRREQRLVTTKSIEA